VLSTYALPHPVSKTEVAMPTAPTKRLIALIATTS
jgi:hypothetical protein